MEHETKSRSDQQRARPAAERTAAPGVAATFVDHRPTALAQGQLADAINNSPRMVAQRTLAEAMDQSPRAGALRALSSGLRRGPRTAAQRQPLGSTIGDAVQPEAGLEGDEVLQGKGKIAPVQRNGRAANPHERAGSYAGWDLTAHHVVAHSKLLEGLKALPEDRQNRLLARAVPDTITEAMLLQFTVNVNTLPEVLSQQKSKKQAMLDITAALKDPNVPESFEIGTSTAGKIRQGFFEWQGGNQFVGPNTSIRPEPADSKDAIDTDLSYMPGSAHAATLIAHGRELYAALAKSTAAEGRENEINVALERIIDTARNIVPEQFDPASWVEVAEKARIEKLVVALGRAHMFAYTYFKFPAPKEGETWAGFDELKPTNSGLSEFSYGTEKVPARVGGGFVFVKVPDAKTVIPIATQEKNLSDECEAGSSGIIESGDQVTVTFKAGVLKDIEAKTVSIGDWPVKIPHQGVDGTRVVFVKKLYKSKKLVRKVEQRSLYDYLESRNVKLATYIPKQLNDTVAD